LIGVSLEEYTTLSTAIEKDKFFNAIVRSIQMSGGRFLRRQPDDRGWEEINVKQAKEKVRHAFRDIMMKRKKLPMIREDDSSPVIKRNYISAERFDWKGIVANAESADRTSPHEVILEPTDLDILHGRDDFSIHHIGNMCFHTVIGYSYKQYLILPTRSEKIIFLSAIVDTIHNSGGRFLHRGSRGEGWEQDDVQKAKQMVGHTLRNVIKKPGILNGLSLIHTPGLLRYFKTAYDFDWRGMVEEAQCLQSEMKNFARENVDVDCEDDISLGSDSSLYWLVSSSDFLDL
jgi:hypothetical protein